MTEENNEKENSINQEEVDTSKTTNEKDNSKMSESPEEKAIAQRDRLYARLKKEEDANKELKEKLKKVNSGPKADVDMDFITDAMSALSDLDETERKRLKKESILQENSLGEARNSQDFKFWLKSYRVEKQNNQAPDPSTKMDLQDNSSKGQVKKFTSGNMTPEEKRKFLLSLGVIRNYNKPTRPGASLNPINQG